MRKQALLIGINDYHLLNELKYARQDAEAFSEALQEYCGFSEDEITLMSCDAPGSCRAQSAYIEQALTDLTGFRNLDLLVFGFWGHGFAPEPGKRFLCGTHTMENQLERTAVSLDVVKARLSQVGAENTLMILDCCQNRPGGRSASAETLSRGEEAALTSIARDIQTAGKKTSKFSIPTVAILNACREGQKAYEWDKKEHGIFTAYILETLSSGCNSVAQLASSIFSPVAKTAHTLYSQEQTPYFDIKGKGDIILGLPKKSDSKKTSPQTTNNPPPRRKKAEPVWWYTTADNREEKTTEPELIALLKTGQLSGSTEVWCEGLDDWVELKEVPKLSKHLSSNKPPNKKKREPSQKNGDILTVPEFGMKLVYVAPGSFMMGADDNEAYDDEQPVHKVTFTQGYWIGKYPVTQEEYEHIMGFNLSRFEGPRLPVESVSWKDAVLFCKKLTRQEHQKGRLPSGYEFRLPTEAEWEFAARGGTDSMGYKYSGSDTIDHVAWYDDNSNHETHEVGLKAPNELDLYDMSGNVWEWCMDDWHDNYDGAPSNGSRWGDGTGSYRVNRGGSWFNSSRSCRSAVRYDSSPGNASIDLGFRVVFAPVQ